MREQSVAQHGIPRDDAASPSKSTTARDDPAQHPREANPHMPDEIVARASARWCGACAAGGLASLPLAWLLSYAAALPFFIGLFFFVLFGLIIGAVIHRVAAPGRPYGRSTLVMGTALVVLFGWSLSMLKEARDFPSDRADYVGRRTGDLGGRTIEEFHEAVAAQVRQYLREKYAPGGVIGYIRWALTSGEIAKGELKDVRMRLGKPQQRYTWSIRVVLSLGLFTFGIGSQTWPLRLTADRPVRAMDMAHES
ncbi:MAG: hypothetical protein ACE5HE_06215 [Phycisphaerae bacterium]